MDRRAKAILTLFAVGFIGFMLGALANILYLEVFPILIKSFPHIFASSWVAWGFGGAMLAIIGCIIYAYLL
ncbi:MAG: hypothetical protein QXX99_06050 [Candidatus Bathyarchaeia archaeon]